MKLFQKNQAALSPVGFMHGIFAVITVTLLFCFMGSSNLYSQLCPNNSIQDGVPANVGIQSASTNYKLNIGGNSTCGDVTMQLNYGSENPTYQGFLSLLTPQNFGSYTMVPTHREGDIVLSSPTTQGVGGNIILTTKDMTKSIVFATSNYDYAVPVPPRPIIEYERQKIYPNGKIDFNIGLWNGGLPRITLKDDAGNNPTINLYRHTGTELPPDPLSYPWSIQCSGEWGTGRLSFLSIQKTPTQGSFAKIGQEVVVPFVNFLSTGNVGINNINPVTKLQVTDGNVLFDGSHINNNYDIIPSGASDRFMWVASKKALRAGGTFNNTWNPGGHDWDEAKIGEYSIALGANNVAKGPFAVSLGRDAEANDADCFAAGHAAVAGQPSPDSTADSSHADCIALGHKARAVGFRAHALGYYVEAAKRYTLALGNNVTTDTTSGSCIIGDGCPDGAETYTYTRSSCNNQMTMRFSGQSNSTEPAYRFFTTCNNSLGTKLDKNATAWSAMSDRNKKNDIKPVDLENILISLDKIPMNTWSYIEDDTRQKYMGPMAQDFYSTFGLGRDGDSLWINSMNIDGVNMAGVKALIRRTDDLKKENEELKQRVTALEEKVKILVEQNQSSTTNFNNFNDILLEQNNPNPFSETSTINYFIPDNYQGSTELVICSSDGNRILQKQIIKKGMPSVATVSSTGLDTGVYLYGILLNGKIIKSNKMMVIK